MHHVPHSLSLCVLFLAAAALAQELAPAPAPAPATPPPAAAAGAYATPAPYRAGAEGDKKPGGYGYGAGGGGGGGGGGAPYGKSYGGYQYVDKYQNLKIDPKHPIDYLPHRRDGGVTDQSNLTLSDLSDLTINDFHVEPRDIFHLMDQVMTPTLDGQGQPVLGADGKPVLKLTPLKFDLDNSYNPENPDQRAVFGRNTWLLWCGGNEDFWDYLAQSAYGVLDFLYALDSRKHDSRLDTLGLINQPGLKASTKAGPWGLYLDTVEQPIGEEGTYKLPYTVKEYDEYARAYADPQGRTLKTDGVNPKVYGYPSGVIGLRLFPNPKFFEMEEVDDGKGGRKKQSTRTAMDAQQRWNADAFYNDRAYATDPRTIRPFTVGMSCAICHVSIHPLNPPADAEKPKWENLSSIIGANYFRPVGAFATRVERANFLWQYVASQQPGCIDTSMTASDQINNGNVMNPVFEMPARVHRALLNPTEIQSQVAQTMPGLGGITGDRDRRIARVLMDGADSIGVFAALSRVYLNIGLFHDEWNLTSNTIIGMTPQKPFTIDVCRRNSLYWRVNENFRMGYLQDFFTWEKKSPTELRKIWAGPAEEQAARFQCSTQAMLIKDASVPTADGKTKPFVSFEKSPSKKEGERVSDPYKSNGAAGAAWDEPAALRGSKVFTDNCMVCHSSKQPEGFALEFAQKPPKGLKLWRDVPADGSTLTMPYSFADWKDFTESKAFQGYQTAARSLATKKDKPEESDWTTLQGFLRDNYLSTDLRIPVSLVETNAGRALGTNAVKGNVWSDYASVTYQTLPAVGEITYYDPIDKKQKTFQPPGGGPGYYRVPSLVGVWTCAPLLNNNALGTCLPDRDWNYRVSLEGRLEMFDDAINKLLWKSKRPLTPSGEYGLRSPGVGNWHGSDPGWVFRTDIETEFRIPSGHLRHLVLGVLPGLLPEWAGNAVIKALDFPRLIPLLLALVSLALVAWWPRGFFYLLMGAGVVLSIVLLWTGVHYLVPWVIWLLPLGLLFGGLAWIITLPFAKKAPPLAPGAAAPAPASKLERLKQQAAHLAFVVARWAGVAAYVVLLVGLLAGLWAGREFVNGNLGDLRLGPFPKGMPVNALMNMDPAAPLCARVGAVRGLCKMLGKLHAENAREHWSEELRRRYLVKHPAAPPQQWPRLYRFSEEDRLKVFEDTAGPALMNASKCKDFVLDRGHYFGEALTDDQKKDLIAFLKTL